MESREKEYSYFLYCENEMEAESLQSVAKCILMQGRLTKTKTLMRTILIIAMTVRTIVLTAKAIVSLTTRPPIKRRGRRWKNL